MVTAKMTKEEVQGRVLQNGKPLELSKFMWDDSANIFATSVPDLVIDFQGIANCTFTTGSSCTFRTEWGCAFKTGWCCTFKTAGDCTFKTGPYCIFETGNWCTFNTRGLCTFNTRGQCTFKTGNGCTFTTGDSCVWVVDDVKYPFAPLFIMGSQWPVNVYRPGYLKIGCEDRTFEEWGRDAEKVAKEEEVSPEVLEEYLGLIEVAKVWAKQKGWLLPL